MSSSSLVAVPYLSLGEPQGGRQLRSFGQGQVLRALEPPLQLLDLQRRVDGARLPHLLALAVDPGELAILDALLDVVCHISSIETKIKCVTFWKTDLYEKRFIQNLSIFLDKEDKHYMACVMWRQRVNKQGVSTVL